MRAWSGRWAVGGFLVGATLGPLFEPWARRLARVRRCVAREPALDIHLEWDQSVVWAGWPAPGPYAHPSPLSPDVLP